MKIKTCILATLLGALLPCTAQTQTELKGASGLAAIELNDVDKLFLETADNTKALLLGIKDKASADAAAPKIKAVLAKFDAEWASMEDRMPEELARLVGLRLIDLLDQAQEVDVLVRQLAAQNPPFYGSDALKDALTIKDDEEEVARPSAPLTQEQQTKAEAMLGKFLDSADKTITILQGIKDKGTADAAAPSLRKALEENDSLWESIQEWAEKEGVAEEVDDMLQARFHDRMEKVQEMDELMLAIINHEPPYYGSAALADIFSADSDELVEPDDEEEQE